MTELALPLVFSELNDRYRQRSKLRTDQTDDKNLFILWKLPKNSVLLGKVSD